MGVHASVRTHWDPQPVHAKSGSSSPVTVDHVVPVGRQAQLDWQGQTASLGTSAGKSLSRSDIAAIVPRC